MKQRKQLLRVLVVAVVVAAVVVFFALGLPRYFSLHELKARQESLQDWRSDYPWTLAGGFFVGYVAMAAVSLPGAAVIAPPPATAKANGTRAATSAGTSPVPVKALNKACASKTRPATPPAW